jgi:hypothetical protein
MRLSLLDGFEQAVSDINLKVTVDKMLRRIGVLTPLKVVVMK